MKCLFKMYVGLFPGFVWFVKQANIEVWYYEWKKKSSDASMKRVLNPLLPKTEILEQCESLCKRQIIFENQPELTLGFDSGAEWKQSFFWWLVYQSITSLSVKHAIHILSRSGWEGLSPWRMIILMEMSHHVILEIRIRIRAQPSTFFSLRIFLFYYIDMHMA